MENGAGLSTKPLTVDSIHEAYRLSDTPPDSWIGSISGKGVVTFGGALAEAEGPQLWEKVQFLFEAVKHGETGVLGFIDYEPEGLGNPLAVVIQFDGLHGVSAGDSLVVITADTGITNDDLTKILQ